MSRSEQAGSEQDVRERAGRPVGRLRRRGIVVMGVVLVALLAFGSTTRTWLTVRLPREAVQSPDLTIAGTDAATPVTALALVALAAAVAVSIAGPVARWIIASLLVLSGAGIILASSRVALDPARAAAPAIGAASGVSSLPGAEAAATAMPWLAAAAGALLVLAAVWVILVGRTWSVNKRYDAGASRAVRPAPDDTRPGAPVPSTGDVAPGVVPDAGGNESADGPGGGTTNGTAGATGTAGAAEQDRRVTEDGAGPRDLERSSKRAGRASSHADEIDSWDELSRGNDPTR